MTKEALERLQDLQDVVQVLHSSNVSFEAHHWGSYSFTTAFAADKGLLPVAISRDALKEHFLFYDAERDGFFLPEKTEFCIGKSLAEFLDLPIASNTSAQHFDRREDLLSLVLPEQYVLTPIKNLDQFDFIQTYEVLLQLAISLSDKKLAPQEIKSLLLQSGQKEISVKQGERVQKIRLREKGYDDEILHGLNLLLLDAGVDGFKFFATEAEDGTFVLLKLSETDMEDLARRGLLL